MPRYISQSGLFSASYFERVSRDAAVPRERRPPEDVDARIARLVAIWSDVRPHVVRAARPGRAWVGLPPDLEPLPNAQERKAEDDLVKRVLIEVLGYAVESQRALALSDALGVTIVPDQLAFPSVAAWRAANEAAGSSKRAPSARDYARGACLVVDAKRLSKGVGADEQDEASPPPSKSARRLVSGDAGAAADIEQVAGYLSACGKRWGVLTNGRSWRLMRAGSRDAYLRFDLALYAEDLFRRAKNRDGDVVGVLTDEDRHVFTLFFWLFGLHGTDGGWLDEIGRESDAEARSVRDVLRAQAHEAVVIIARGFLEMPANRLKAQKARSSLLPHGPEEPSQTQLDMLREVALVFLYRLLFALKAEASNLLPLADENGASTLYRKYASTQSIFDAAARIEPSDRARTTAAFRMVEDLFHTIDAGNAYEVPPYDGGLFDASEHPELEWLALHDAAVHALLGALIYLNGDAARPVPYADLDVRDLGDIYEGLLEQRLAFEELGGERRLSLRSERSERKGSGSYFTPDALVEHLVRATLDPLLDAAGSDCAKVLALRVVDPAMGSGHFLVKAIDHIAWYLTLYCDPSDLAAPSDNGPRELAYWRRRVVESCIYGVDVNPMAVELAKVALWLHTAERGKRCRFSITTCGAATRWSARVSRSSPHRRSGRRRPSRRACGRRATRTTARLGEARGSSSCRSLSTRGCSARSSRACGSWSPSRATTLAT